MLIDKVIVYGADAIEIVWKVGNPFNAEIMTQNLFYSVENNGKIEPQADIVCGSKLYSPFDTDRKYR